MQPRSGTPSVGLRCGRQSPLNLWWGWFSPRASMLPVSFWIPYSCKCFLWGVCFCEFLIPSTVSHTISGISTSFSAGSQEPHPWRLRIDRTRSAPRCGSLRFERVLPLHTLPLSWLGILPSGIQHSLAPPSSSRSLKVVLLWGEESLSFRRYSTDRWASAARPRSALSSKGDSVKACHHWREKYGNILQPERV